MIKQSIKLFAIIPAFIIGLFITLALNGVFDFLKQVIKIELGENNPIISAMILGIFVAIAFGVFIGKKSYIFFTNKPNLKPFKMVFIQLALTVATSFIIFVISMLLVVGYMQSINLPESIFVQMYTNLGAKLFFLSPFFGWLIISKIYKGKTHKDSGYNSPLIENTSTQSRKTTS